jgi:PAS domain S-box-containing protein
MSVLSLDPTALAILVLTTLNLSLGIFVFSRNPKRPAHRWFALFVVSVSVWSLGLAGAYSRPDRADLTLLFGRIAFSGSSLIPFCFLAFVKYFPTPSSFPTRSTLLRLAILPGVFSAVSFSPWLLADLSLTDSRLVSSHGRAYPLFAIYFLAAIITSFVLLFRKFRRATGIARLQIKYLFLGALAAVAGGTTTNLVIPLVFRTSHFGGYGPLFVSVLIAFATHSIIRYRLMDIRLVVRQGMIYLLSATVAGAFFVALLFLASFLTLSPTPDLSPLAQLSIVLIIAVLFQPLKERLQRALDRYVYRRRYDYQHEVRTATRTISSLLDLDSLLRYLCDMTATTFQPEAVVVYVRDTPQRAFVAVAHRQLIDSPTVPSQMIASDSPILRFISESKTHFIRDDVSGQPRSSAWDLANRTLAAQNADLALPLLDGAQLVGLMLVSPKLSGDPYFADDIDLLSTLAQQAAVALKNAQLYNEVLTAKDYISNLLSTMESGVVAVDPNGTVTQFNRAAARLTGLDANDVVSASLDALPPALASHLSLTLIDGGSRTQDELTLLDGAGHLVPIVSSTSSLRNRDNRQLGAVIVFSDVTQLKELEAQKRRVERLASLGSLASGIAHEIKNPLVAIRTFAELLPERYNDEDFRDGFAQVVIKEITRIDDLVARLRGLAAPETPPPLAPLDLLEPIEETLRLLRAKLEQAHIAVKKDYAAISSAIAGDPSQLKQLFLNLFLNAVEATDSDGELAVKVSNRSSLGLQTVLVEISDSGCGIPPALLPRVFEPFVTSKRTGSGLGLAICRGIADAHSAKIQASNNDGRQGATISVEFPLQPLLTSYTVKPD